MSDTASPTIDNPAAAILAGLPDVSPDELAGWPADQRDAYLQARAELVREAEQLQVVTSARTSPTALLADVQERAAAVRAARLYEEQRAAADQAYRQAIADFGDTRVARIDMLDGRAIIVRAPTEPEVEQLDVKILRLNEQADRTKAQAEIVQAQRWAWEKCIVYPRNVKDVTAGAPLIWGDIRAAYSALGRGVEDARRGKF